MADSKTSNLSALTTASAADLLYIASGGTSYKITLANLRASILAAAGTVYGGAAAGSTLSLFGTSNGSPALAYLLLNTIASGVFPGTVGIGTPSAKFISGSVLALQGSDTVGTTVTMDNYGAGSNANNFVMRAATGTSASPGATAAGDRLLAFGGRGYETTSPGFTGANNALIAMFAQQAFTNAAQGTYISLETTQNGSTARNKRLVVGGEKALTDGATDMFDITLNTLEMVGGCVLWTIIASNGTDMQAFSGVSYFSAVNKGAAYTTNISDHTVAANTNSKSVSSGTLTAAFTFNNGTNKVTFRVTPAGSLTETTYKIIYTVINNSPAAITLL